MFSEVVLASFQFSFVYFVILALLKFLGDAEPTTTDRENLVSLLEDKLPTMW